MYILIVADLHKIPQTGRWTDYDSIEGFGNYDIQLY